jgi:uncharacterized membrane protein
VAPGQLLEKALVSRVWNVAGMILLLAFLLGIVSGLRTFTAPAVLWIMRHKGLWAYVLAAAALFEYFYDVHPKAPPRTCTSNVVARLLSGAFVGWWAAVAAGALPASGAIAGGIGALVGAYGSLPLRRRAIVTIGNVASGLLEDIVAIAVAVAIVARL